MSEQMLRDVRELIQSLPPRNERAALAAMADLREWFAPLGSPSCPMCGHLVDYRDGTHIRSGYRTCLRPPRPGSWMAEQDSAEPDVSSGPEPTGHVKSSD